ncbi:hypothetical protein [Bradyrhizobium sp. SZCCHNRI2049]|uniref:hypothetical protein n=1 Tax=Bradyrhizobium sp. SZCCHNRI2049 TaxID=3057287 RepID=UPI002916883E|nr:hypothetical protein [Bradyrhizobium sp. SZCCHNRI2049]
MRDELLKETLFFGLDDTTRRLTDWGAGYSNEAHYLAEILDSCGYAANLSGGVRLRSPDQLRQLSAAPFAIRRASKQGSKDSWMKLLWQIRSYQHANVAPREKQLELARDS